MYTETSTITKPMIPIHGGIKDTEGVETLDAILKQNDWTL